MTIFYFIFYFIFYLISLIAEGPHHYHPACGHKGSSHLSPVHALHFFYRDASSALFQIVNQWLNFTTGMCVCMCCVFFPFILDIKFVGRTSRGHTGGRSHRRKVTQDFSSTFFLRCVPSFFSRRIQPFLSLVDCAPVGHF